MAGLLEGIRVLEVSTWVAGPACGAMMADLGAEVIKIEHPETGDPIRGVTVSTNGGIVPYTGGVNRTFELLNRGKQSIAINLQHPRGQQVVRKLATQSDVMLTNLTPHRQKRYGLRYEDVSAVNSRIIYAIVTGYGMDGPDRDRSGFDAAAFQARAGIMASIGEPNNPPVNLRPGMGDLTTSLALISAIALGLYERERSGRGQRIDTSLLHTGLWILGPDVVAAYKEHQPVRRLARTEIRNPLHGNYETGDGKWIALVMIESERFWPGFCKALGLEHIVADPRFGSHASRMQHSSELIGILDKQFTTQPRHEWGRRLDDQGCLWGPIQTVDEVVEDPQVSANSYTTSLEHPEEGDYWLVNAPMKFQRTPGEIKMPAPELGQSTEIILLDLGYTWDDIVALKEQGIII